MISMSIIMPLYNAEKFLFETLSSILKQTYQDFELICINDASMDDTLKILYQFQKKDYRIKVIENVERMGAAASRNRGISVAKGEYITFLDGDDIFDESMLELAYKKIEEYDAEIVMYEYEHVASDYIYEKKRKYRSDLFIEKYCNTPFSILDFHPIEFTYWSASPCNKLYRKSFILSNKLEFQTLASSNDVYFVSMALLLAHKIIMLDDRRIMLYARDHDSLSRISYDRDPMCMYLAMKKMYEEIVKRKLQDRLSRNYYYALFYNLRLAILKTKNIDKAKQFYVFLQREGIDDIYRVSNEPYKESDKWISALIKKFKNLDFESGWYDIENMLNYYLYKEEERITSFFHGCAEQNQQIVVWGAGGNGKTLLNFLEAHNINKIEVVDKDRSKQGTLISGFNIRCPEDVLKKNQIILTSSYDIYKDVLAKITDTSIKIISIEEIIGMA